MNLLILQQAGETRRLVNTPLCSIAPDVRFGKDVKVLNFVNLYGCTIGDETKIGAFVEIQKNAHVGAAARSVRTRSSAKA